MIHREEVSDMVQRIMKAAPFSMRQWAEDASLRYNVLRAWASGKRTPKPENIQQLADGLETRAERLRELAQELRSAASDGSNAS